MKGLKFKQKKTFNKAFLNIPGELGRLTIWPFFRTGIILTLVFITYHLNIKNR
jgi:hypothetical protein